MPPSISISDTSHQETTAGVDHIPPPATSAARAVPVRPRTAHSAASSAPGRRRPRARTARRRPARSPRVRAGRRRYTRPTTSRRASCTGRHDGRHEDRGGEVHPEQDTERGSERDQQLRAPEQLARESRQEQDRRPPFPETRLERIDQRGEAMPSHGPGEEKPAENQADAEAEAALDAKLNRRLVRRFGGAEQVAAIDPRGRHRERGHPQRHLPPRDDEIGCRAVPGLARRQPAHHHEGGVHRHHGHDRGRHRHRPGCEGIRAPGMTRVSETRAIRPENSRGCQPPISRVRRVQATLIAIHRHECHPTRAPRKVCRARLHQ